MFRLKSRHHTTIGDIVRSTERRMEWEGGVLLTDDVDIVGTVPAELSICRWSPASCALCSG